MRRKIGPEKAIREISDYRPSMQWKRSDDWRAKAADGSLVWMDMRGLVGLQQPSGLYVTLSASTKSAHGELHDGRYGPPPKKDPIRLFVSDMGTWRRGGYATKEKIPKELQRALLDSLERGLRALGYSVKYARPKKRDEAD